MRNISAAFVLFCLFAFKCEPEIEFNGNERLLFSGRIVDFNAEGLNGVPVEIIASQTYISSFFSQIDDLEDGELSGSGFSKEDGSFDIISLSPRNADTYTVINPPFSRDYDATRISYAISETVQRNENQTIAFSEDIVLDKISNFEVQVNRITNLTDTLEYSVRFSPLTVVESLEESSEFQADFNDFIGDELLPMELTSFNDFPMRENDALIFSYRLSGDGIQRDSTILTNAEKRSFVFEF